VASLVAADPPRVDRLVEPPRGRPSAPRPRPRAVGRPSTLVVDVVP